MEFLIRKYMSHWVLETVRLGPKRFLDFEFCSVTGRIAYLTKNHRIVRCFQSVKSLSPLFEFPVPRATDAIRIFFAQSDMYLFVLGSLGTSWDLYIVDSNGTQIQAFTVHQPKNFVELACTFQGDLYYGDFVQFPRLLKIRKNHGTVAFAFSLEGLTGNLQLTEAHLIMGLRTHGCLLFVKNWFAPSAQVFSEKSQIRLTIPHVVLAWDSELPGCCFLHYEDRLVHYDVLGEKVLKCVYELGVPQRSLIGLAQDRNVLALLVLESGGSRMVAIDLTLNREFWNCKLPVPIDGSLRIVADHKNRAFAVESGMSRNILYYKLK